MAKLRVVRLSLITLQLISLTVASVIIIVHYNPWIERMIVEAERSGNTSQSLADQIQRIEGEEIVIFLMSAATILVSVIGIIGTLRGHEHNHCMLNFYMSTLIIFLFVIFMALCGTIWEMISKLQYSQSVTSQVVQLSSNTPTANPFDSSYDLVGDEDLNGNVSGRNSGSTVPLNPKAALTSTVTWLYIAKSLLFISLSAVLYATSLRLTRKILESSDDHYLSASDDGDEDDLNSEASSSGGIAGIPPQYMIGFRSHTPYSNHSYNNFHQNIAGVYSNNMMTKSGTGVAAIAAPCSGGPGSPFRNV